MHDVIGMCGIVQILIEIPAFDPEVFIEGPAEARKRSILIEAELDTRGCRIDSYEELVPNDQAQTRFKFQRVHESNHLAWTYPDIIALLSIMVLKVTVPMLVGKT